MYLSFLFRSSTLPQAAISCHENATFRGQICVIPQNVVSEIVRCHITPVARFVGASQQISLTFSLVTSLL
jgi:hypothetical protein